MSRLCALWRTFVELFWSNHLDLDDRSSYLKCGCTCRYWVPKTIHQSEVMQISFQISLPLLEFNARGSSKQKSIPLGLNSAAEGISSNPRRAKHESIENPSVENLLRRTSCHFLFRGCMRRKAESFPNKPGRCLVLGHMKISRIDKKICTLPNDDESPLRPPLLLAYIELALCVVTLESFQVKGFPHCGGRFFT